MEETRITTSGRPGPLEPRGNGIRDLGRRISGGVQTLVKDHVELARHELARGTRTVAVDTTAMLLGGVFALVGFAMLCATAVPALAGLGWPLWLRMLIMSAVYLLVGAVVLMAFVRKLRGAVPPRMTATRDEARLTAQAVKSAWKEEQHA